MFFLRRNKRDATWAASRKFFHPGKPWTFYLCICSYLDVKVFSDNAICVNYFLVMGIFRQHKWVKILLWRHSLLYVTLKEAIVQLQANWEKFFLLIAHLFLPLRVKSLILKRPSDLISNEKKILMPGRKNIQHQDHEITYVTG